MFYLTTHSTHFIYGYMASDIWLRTILIVRKETRCRHIGYSYRFLLYAPSHRQDNTYHGLCYTSRGALAGTRNRPPPKKKTQPKNTTKNTQQQQPDNTQTNQTLNKNNIKKSNTSNNNNDKKAPTTMFTEILSSFEHHGKKNRNKNCLVCYRSK